MGVENSGGLPEGIDPSKLVVQSGESAGRIAEVELARVGAEAEDEYRETAGLEIEDEKVKEMTEEEYRDTIKSNQAYEGNKAMGEEVMRRAAELTENDPSFYSENVQEEAKIALQREMNDPGLAKRNVAELAERSKARDEAEAQKILTRLRDMTGRS